MRRAAVLLELHRPDEVVELLAPLAATSADTELHTLLVQAFVEAYRFEEGLLAAEFALAKIGPVPELTRVCAFLYGNVGQPEKAMAMARACVSAAPNWVPGLLVLVRAHMLLKEWTEAESTGAAVLALAPQEPAVHTLLAEVATGRGRVRLARSRYEAALRLDPSWTKAMSGLGMLEERRSRFGHAARWYARVLATAPGDDRTAERVRGLFGQALLLIAAGALVLDIVLFIAAMTVAAPHGSPPNPVASVFWSIVAFGLVGGLLWLSLHAAPRVVLDVFRSDSRRFRQVRAAVRRTVTQTVLLAGVAVAAIVPMDGDSRVGVVFLFFFTDFVVGLVNMIALRVSFGYGGRRPASR